MIGRYLGINGDKVMKTCQVKNQIVTDLTLQLVGAQCPHTLLCSPRYFYTYYTRSWYKSLGTSISNHNKTDFYGFRFSFAH